MVSDPFEAYARADAPLPTTNRLWPLYGAGMDNFGVDRKPIEVPMPEVGPDELLVRHDACGHCFSDIKVIRAGQDHPRIYRDMREDPVVLGHEISLTVVGVGENLKDEYAVGDRFIVQADIFVDGIGYAYGYEIQGGLSEYTVIDQRVLNGDHGNYLIKVQPSTGYAEAALAEPWACVIAAYELRYRSMIRPKGTMWVIGTDRAKDTIQHRQRVRQSLAPGQVDPDQCAAGLRCMAARAGRRAGHRGRGPDRLPRSRDGRDR